MKVLFIIAVATAVVFTKEVEGFMRGGFHPIPPNHPRNMFPACNDFFYAIDRQLHENERQSDRPRCDWQQYQQECYFEKLVKARMDVQDIQPSTSCTNQMRDFMSGVNNPTTPRTTTTPSYV
ncbi:uncharacterized protein [Parasteatoda tepidariorum]|uniref:uncharacterized protein n=1 Tax=Parasteatoda tepidariorum TaxID=114398 RepID=UPI001C71E76C|nr:uncharacterized protein LOC107449770 isoform X1 [Parasteatoda tepidariorum]